VHGVSVVICAHNSAARIRPTLQALSRCNSDFDVEIILVDNNSSDETAARAIEIWNTSGNDRFKFSVIREPLAGLAYARRAGVFAASGDVVVFCDDDNWLDQGYLNHAARIMADPSIGAAGGCAIPTRPERLPPWFYTFAWGFAVGVPLEMIGRLPDFPATECEIEALWGAGLVVRRDAIAFLYTLPNFPALTGRKNGALLSGEDLEISACIACAGYKLIFSTALQFQHDIASERLELNYAKRLFENFGQGFAILGDYGKIIEAAESPRRAAAIGIARIAKHVALGRLARNSFLSILAALRLSQFMTEDQRRIFDTVRSVRERAAAGTFEATGRSDQLRFPKGDTAEAHPQ
jgi:glycosyltransferase involved in cell wall biosynthesis